RHVEREVEYRLPRRRGGMGVAPQKHAAVANRGETRGNERAGEKEQRRAADDRQVIEERKRAVDAACQEHDPGDQQDIEVDRYVRENDRLVDPAQNQRRCDREQIRRDQRELQVSEQRRIAALEKLRQRGGAQKKRQDADAQQEQPLDLAEQL